MYIDLNLSLFRCASYESVTVCDEISRTMIHIVELRACFYSNVLLHSMEFTKHRDNLTFQYVSTKIILFRIRRMSANILINNSDYQHGMIHISKLLQKSVLTVWTLKWH
jgi:phosphopantothenate synthetase